MNSISLTTFTMMKINLDIGFPMEFTLVEVRQCIVHWVSHFIERPQTSRQGEGHCCWLSYVLASSSIPPKLPSSSSPSLLLSSNQIERCSTPQSARKIMSWKWNSSSNWCKELTQGVAKAKVIVIPSIDLGSTVQSPQWAFAKTFNHSIFLWNYILLEMWIVGYSCNLEVRVNLSILIF